MSVQHNENVPGRRPAPQRPKRHRFHPTDRIRHRGRYYPYIREVDGGHVLRAQPDGMEEAVTDAEMQAIVEDPDFARDRGFYGEAAVMARGLSDAKAMSDLPQHEQDAINRKVFFCRRFRELEAESRHAAEAGDDSVERVTRSDESMARALHRIRMEIAGINSDARMRYPDRRSDGDGRGLKPVEDRGAPTPKTLRKWLAVYEVALGYPLALRDRRRRSGNRTARLHPAVYAIINGQCKVYLTEKRATVVTCHDAACDELAKLNLARAGQGLEKLPEPSIAAVRRAINAIPAFRRHAGRHGLDAAKKRFRLVKQSVEVLRPGERVEMDEWTIQLHTLLQKVGVWTKLTDEQRKASRGRWTVCVAIDVATRVRLAMCMAPKASGSLAKRTLHMVLIDKTHLAPDAVTPWDMALSPDCVVTDAGPAFTSAEFRTALADLGARHDVPPGGMPHLRPYIERSFGETDTSLLTLFTGRTFSDARERGDYDAEARASLTTDEFGRALVIHNCDVYNNAPHAGLGGETPRNAWLRLTDTFGCPPPPGPHDRRAIFGTEIERRVSLRGVRFMGLHYSDEELGAHILKRGLFKARIRVDEEDLGHVSLWTPGGWRPLACRAHGFAGVSVEEFVAAAQDLRRRHAKAAHVTRGMVLDAIARIRAIAAKAEARSGIELRLLGPERLDAEERELLAGFDLDIADGDDGDGLGEGGIELIPTGPGGGGTGGAGGGEAQGQPQGGEPFVDYGSIEEE